VRRLSAVIVCAAACALIAASSAASGASSNAPRSSRATAAHSTTRPWVRASSTARAGGALSQLRARARRAEARRFLAIANALPKVRAVRAEYPRAFEVLSDLPSGNRQVLYYQPAGNLPPKEVGEVIIDGHSGRVLEAWTGFQLEWELARGYPGFLGRHVNALYIWLPLCILFLLPFVNFRRPFSLLHLDLLMLLSFSVSLVFFNDGHIYASVPLAYPPLIYLLARMLVLARPGRRRSVRDVGSESEGAAVAGAPALVPARTRPGSQHLMVPTPWLVLGIVLLTGFRIGLNVTDSNVLDAGQAGVIGAQRIVEGEPLYGSYPAGHSDTYGPVNYEAYIPFEQLFGRKGTAAAHAAAIVFDLLSVVMMFLLGRRVRGPTLGIALAYAWVSYPFTLYVLESNSNDALVAVLVLAALLAATYRSKIGQTTRGAFTALAGLTKFAPLALAPLLATHELRACPPGRRPRELALFLGGFVGAVALVFIPVLSHDSLHTIYEQTIAFQANRTSPFSVWGLYGGLGGLQLTVQIAAVLLAFALALLPRRPDLIGLAAACAAVIVATQLGIKHWFYTYIPWFFPLAMLALLGSFSAAAAGAAGASTRGRAAQDEREPVDREELAVGVVRRG
jgi:hypothetical protein